MNLHLLRALFVLLMASVGYYYLLQVPGPFAESSWATLSVAVAAAVLILSVDILSSRRKLLNLSAVLFGTTLGIAIGWVMGLVVTFLIGQYVPGEGGLVKKHLIEFLQALVYVSCCYILISFIMQTKDDIRFIIPYVEFAKQTKGARPILLDTSALIDGRVVVDAYRQAFVDEPRLYARVQEIGERLQARTGISFPRSRWPMS
jgi:uncharacterized protein YacL